VSDRVDVVFFTPEHLVTLAKEFGGGFGAYWTHHVFAKVWLTTAHIRLRGKVGKR
jgi:hypothetical protein